MRITGILAVLLLCAGHVYAEVAVGDRLVRIDRTEDAVIGLIGDIFASDSDEIKGAIRSVTVLAATEHTLQIAVEYTNFQGGRITATVQGAQGARLRQITQAHQTVASADTQSIQTIELEFNLQNGLGEDFELRSGQLEVSVTRQGHSVKQHVSSFAMDKLWTMQLAPENVAIQVTPAPLANAASWVGSLTSTGGATGTAGAATAGALRPVVLELPAARYSELRPLSVSREALTTERRSTNTTTPATINERVSLQRSESVLLNNKTVIEKLPQAYSKVTIANYNFAQKRTPATPQSTEPTNEIGSNYLDLFQGVEVDGLEYVDVGPADILGVYGRIYPDKNANSGVYYYIPESYRLAYDEDLGGAKGLGFRISYDRIGDEVSDDAVRMAVSLDSALSFQEIDIAEQIVSRLARRNSLKFTQLKAYPLAAPPLFDFSGGLAGRVDSEDVAVVALSNTLEGIDVSWTTDGITAQNLRRDLRDGIPISGTAAFSAPNTDAPTEVVPMRVELSNPAVFDPLHFSRTEAIRNSSPLPVILKNLHVLVEKADRMQMYSWSLNNTVVPPQASIDLNLDNFPAAIDSAATRIWFQYALDRSCESCIDAVLDELLSGDVWPDTGALTLRALTPLEATSAAEIWIETRSRFFDPNDRTLRDGQRIYLTEDRGEYSIQPIFLTGQTESEDGEEWPLFEYRLSVIMPDGSIYEGQNWIASDNDTVVIGSYQVQQSLGYMPAGTGAEPVG